MQAALPPIAEIHQQLEGAPRIQRLSFNAESLEEWDSRFLTFLLTINELCRQKNVEIDHSGLPKGVQGLLRLATAVPERTGARRGAVKESVLVRIGKVTQVYLQALPDVLDFLGQAVIAFARLLQGKARFRRTDFALILQECGAQALPIVSLISFLVGLILAFVGAVQLRQFGAQMYVADLVGIAMAREMGAMMTGAPLMPLCGPIGNSWRGADWREHVGLRRRTVLQRDASSALIDHLPPRAD